MHGIKHLPNFLSAVRLALAPVLLFVPPLGGAFYAVYLLCGATDVLDGFLARHWHAESRLGARLDSAADFVLCAALLWVLLPVIAPSRGIAVWIAVIFVLRLAAAITAKRRFGLFGFIHTSANKLTGLLLFLYPLSLSVTHHPLVLWLLCAVATFSAAEELLIELTAKTWDADRKSLL